MVESEGNESVLPQNAAPRYQEYFKLKTLCYYQALENISSDVSNNKTDLPRKTIVCFFLIIIFII